MRATLPLAFLMLGSVSAMAQPAPPPAPEPFAKISVVGEGEATIRPDIAMLTLGVMREAETARAALDQNNEAMAAVIEAMKAEGIESRDLQTSNLSIEPRYVYPKNDSEDQQPKLMGYQVTNTLGVRVRDMEKVGAILDKSVTLGVNQGGQINFSSDNPKDTLKEARKLAVKDAMDRARTLAEAAGVELGSVIEIRESSQNQPPRPMAMKAFAERADAAAVPVEAGENAYQVQVNVTFAINQ